MNGADVAHGERRPDPASASAMPSRNPYVQHRDLLHPSEIRELSQLRHGPPLRDSAIAWMEIMACWTAVAIWPRWWVILLAVPIIGSASYALHILGHDALHWRYSPRPARNDLLSDLVLYGPVAAATHVTRRNHLLHHLHLATDQDPDRHKYATAGKTTRTDLVLYLTGWTNVAPVARDVLLLPTVDAAHAAADPRGGIGYSRRDVAIMLGWQIVLLVGLSRMIGLWAYPVLWLLPVYVFRFCADEARQFLEHAHLEPDETADRHRLVSYTSNPLERLFFAPLHMNLHAAHHLWPSIPYYNLPAADRLLRERQRTAELVWRRSYVGTLREYLRVLPGRTLE